MISGRLRASLISRGHQPQLAGIRRPQCRCLHLARAASSAPGLQNAPWTGAPQEQEALRQLQERVRGLALPQEPSPEVQQWFLRDRGFDVAEAADKLAKMSRWRARARPEQLRSSDVAAELRTGKAFVHDKPDRYGRPVVVVLARKHLVDQRNLEESQRLGVYVIEQALSQLDADHDSILGVFDMRGFSWANADFAFVEFLVDLFFNYYPRRLSQVLAVDAPWVFRPAWTIVRPMLRKYAQLVRFVSREELQREFFDERSLPDGLR